MSGMNEVVTIRPAELEITPGFRASVHETPVNVYRMKVDAQSSDARRFSFSWRAPGNNLLCSPQAYIEFDLCVHVPMVYTEEEALSANRGWVDRAGNIDLPSDLEPARNNRLSLTQFFNDTAAACAPPVIVTKSKVASVANMYAQRLEPS